MNHVNILVLNWLSFIYIFLNMIFTPCDSPSFDDVNLSYSEHEKEII